MKKRNKTMQKLCKRWKVYTESRSKDWFFNKCLQPCNTKLKSHCLPRPSSKKNLIVTKSNVSLQYLNHIKRAARQGNVTLKDLISNSKTNLTSSRLKSLTSTTSGRDGINKKRRRCWGNGLERELSWRNVRWNWLKSKWKRHHRSWNLTLIWIKCKERNLRNMKNSKNRGKIMNTRWT